jgi:hypothetical protein
MEDAFPDLNEEWAEIIIAGVTVCADLPERAREIAAELRQAMQSPLRWSSEPPEGGEA